MNFLRSIGFALLSAFITALALFGGLVFSVISTIVSVLIAVAGIFVVVYCAIAGGRQADSQIQKNDKR